MNERLDAIYHILLKENRSLVVRTADGRTLAFSGRGVIDLYRLLTENPSTLSGALVADKAVGLGAATLMSLGGIKALKTPVISQEAYNRLEKSGVSVEAGEIVPYIINRMGTGRCPLEEKLLPYLDETPEKMLGVVREFLVEKGII